MKVNTKRFLLLFFLGFLGSFIINHSKLKPNGFIACTGWQFILTPVPIYRLATAIATLSFNSEKLNNLGYKRDAMPYKKMY